MYRSTTRLVLLFLLLAASAAQAHVGSPDIFVEAKAGPYSLFVTINPPMVIPGVATLSVRSETGSIRRLRAVPLPMSGPGARFAPVPDELHRSSEDPQLFTGSLWMMAPGSWQVRFTADGDAGSGVVAVPVPSAAIGTKTMQTGLGAVLWALMTFLVLGAVAIVGASVREAKLVPGAQPDNMRLRSGRKAMAVAVMGIAVVLWLGDRWWKNEATSYAAKVYKPLQMDATRTGTQLTLRLSDPGWLPTPAAFAGTMPVVRTNDDLVLDHEHLMHLYAIRQPELDVVFHLHPERTGSGLFSLSLPSMPAGRYKLYADVTHASGFPETLVSEMNLESSLAGRALSGDDGNAVATPVSQAVTTTGDFQLPDGFRMKWVRAKSGIQARTPQLFRFQLLDRNGRSPSDMQLYMGMLGHAAFVKTDGSVFAHIHPEGSVSMAALAQAQQSAEEANGSNPPTSAMQNMAGMGGDMGSALPNEVSFPYGLPTPGRYRVFVQMKHGETVETAAFDMQAR